MGVVESGRSFLKSCVPAESRGHRLKPGRLVPADEKVGGQLPLAVVAFAVKLAHPARRQ
jgi:hypothetical protein